jgi:hypothetical protein
VKSFLDDDRGRDGADFAIDEDLHLRH